MSDPTPPIGSLPQTHAECVAAGGELDPERRGGRCHFHTTHRRDPSAYIDCRAAGGVQGAVGRPGSREVVGESHVCTVSFEP